MYASYNPFRHNVYRDAVIVSLMDTFTSLFAGFTVFSILGNLAHELQLDVSEVAKSGPGLIFVSYADAISKFEYVPQFFCSYIFPHVILTRDRKCCVLANDNHHCYL